MQSYGACKVLKSGMSSCERDNDFLFERQSSLWFMSTSCGHADASTFLLLVCHEGMIFHLLLLSQPELSGKSREMMSTDPVGKTTRSKNWCERDFLENMIFLSLVEMNVKRAMNNWAFRGVNQSIIALNRHTEKLEINSRNLLAGMVAWVKWLNLIKNKKFP